jgi:uncharacterized membrane protein
MSKPRSLALELLLASMLSYGTWLASAVIAVGLVLQLVNCGACVRVMPMLSAIHILTGGIALLILLPVARVVLMLFVYLRERDYRFSAIAMLVLMILLFGFVLGSMKGISA